MLYVFLLLIIAILLFGSSRFLGAFGAAMGFCFSAAAFASGLYFAAPYLRAMGFNAEQVPWVMVLIFIGLVGAARIIIHLKDRL